MTLPPPPSVLIGDIWYFTFYNLQAKQVRRSSKSKLKSVAIEMLQQAQEELRKGVEPSSARKTKYEEIRATLIADYLASGKAIVEGEEVVVSGRRGLLKPNDDYFGGMNVASITTDLLRDFSAKRMENGVAGPTVNRNLAMLRRMFKLAERESKVSHVPYFPMQQESEPREGFLERPEFEKLRIEMPRHLRPALTFCYETGCRTGAMSNVIWPWVNLAKQEVCLPPGILKNRKPLIVPLSNELVAMFKKKFKGNARYSRQRISGVSGLRHVLSVGSERRQVRRGINTRALSPTISVAPPFATSSTRVWTQPLP